MGNNGSSELSPFAPGPPYGPPDYGPLRYGPTGDEPLDFGPSQMQYPMMPQMNMLEPYYMPTAPPMPPVINQQPRYVGRPQRVKLMLEVPPSPGPQAYPRPLPPPAYPPYPADPYAYDPYAYNQREASYGFDTYMNGPGYGMDDYYYDDYARGPERRPDYGYGQYSGYGDPRGMPDPYYNGYSRGMRPSGQYYV